MATYWENSCSFGLRYVSWYKYLIVSLVFSHLGFWSGNLFLIAPFPDLCLLVLFYKRYILENVTIIMGYYKNLIFTLATDLRQLIGDTNMQNVAHYRTNIIAPTNMQHYRTNGMMKNVSISRSEMYTCNFGQALRGL